MFLQFLGYDIEFGHNEAAKIIKSNMKISTTEVGIIFGGINYENIAGIEQDYIVTNEIPIDIIDFVYPAYIKDKEFRTLWSKYEWENRVNINT